MNLFAISSSDVESSRFHELLGHTETPDLEALYREFCELFRYPAEIEEVTRGEHGIFIRRKHPQYPEWDRRCQLERFSENRMRKAGLVKCPDFFDAFIEWLCREKGFSRVKFLDFNVWGF